ncbi:MAG: HPF/RaiA family ribosome-associated protein [Acidobacteriia bacterium]|nr:HPF/RaiA family ribosome-associated protein [Terriglobia bacterium]
MNISISYKYVQSRQPVEEEIGRYTGKLSKLLKCYPSDAVHIHGVFARNLHNSEHSFSLNLKLPTGTLHATGTGSDVRASCKQAFRDLAEQVKKHQARLRKDHDWQRKRRLVQQFA